MTVHRSAGFLGLALALTSCPPAEPAAQRAVDGAASGPSAPVEEPDDHPVAEPDPPSPAIDWDQVSSTSLRNPNDGSLQGGVALPLAAPGLRFNPKRDPAARYGTVEVVRALIRAASVVDAEYGGEPLIINDLSLDGGGPIPRHASHQSGRDVDVLFYQLDAENRPILAVGAFFDPDGRGVDFHDLSDPGDDVALTFDAPRTWRFVQALIEDDEAALQSIFVAEHLRSILLDHARSTGAPKATIERFAAMSCQPEYPHDDHFHFRFYCSVEDIKAGCRDSRPTYPWRKRQLAQAGVKRRPMLPKRANTTAKTVSHEEARAAAGPLDAEVERWLDRRKAWQEQPHPGRRYCR